MKSIANRLLGPLVFSLFVAVSLPSAAQDADTAASLKRVRQILVAPPALPDHSQVASGEPTIVEVRLVIEEKEIEVGSACRTPAMARSAHVSP